MKKASLFTNGGSQAVRLPAEFRFEGDSVFVRRDPATGDVILSQRPRLSWAEFVAYRESLGPEDFELQLDRDEGIQARDPFEGWSE